jgi:hypothetical protein
MQVQTEKSLAMIKHDAIPFKIERPRQDYRATIHC